MLDNKKKEEIMEHFLSQKMTVAEIVRIYAISYYHFHKIFTHLRKTTTPPELAGEANPMHDFRNLIIHENFKTIGDYK